MALASPSDGFEITSDVGRLQIQPIEDGLIRVRHLPPGTRPTNRSLSVIHNDFHVPFVLAKKGKTTLLKTKQLLVEVDRTTQVVTFKDVTGRVLLQEHGRPDYTNGVQLAFSTTPTEAIYGLGQHQDGVMNLVGQKIHLEQKNTEIAMPILMSTAGYGLFWDNPSITDVTVGDVPMSVPAAQWLDRGGVAGGLTGEYFEGINFDRKLREGKDATIDFNSDGHPVEGMPKDNYSVRWTGSLKTQVAGTYRFTTTSDDGVRLWVDGKKVIDDWSVHSAHKETKKIALPAGSTVPIRLEYYQGGGGAQIKLECLQPPVKRAQPEVIWSSESGNQTDYYFLYGPKMDDSIAAYRRLTGPAPLFPKWTWGFWQCREHYGTRAELEEVSKTYRSKGIPIDAIIQDWFYWDPKPWGSHVMDPVRYPDPKAMLDDLHAMNIHAIISVWGKFADGSDNFNYLKSKGFLYPKTGDASYYDPFNPAARAAYWALMRDQLLRFGWDGWWLDATEPELSGNWGEFRDIKTAAGPGKEVFNAYPLMTTTAVHDGMRKDQPDKRSFILTRSAYAGQQRNGIVAWSGDILGSWDVFRAQIPAGLNFVSSGIPYWNTDIGGFFGGNPQEPGYRELFLRWFQFGAFCPMFRTHGTYNPKEMWRFGPEGEAIQVKFDRLRYSLLPYIYSQSWQVTANGASLMRPLVFDYPKDTNVYDIPDQFLFGPSILVNPVMKAGLTNRNVYLPKGHTWFDWWTNRALAGGKSVSLPAPLDSMPLLVRSGSIIPIAPPMTYANEKPWDSLTLRVYPGEDATFTLYEDEGDNYNYEKGAYTTIDLRWDDKTSTLTIGDRQGSYRGMLKARAFHVDVIGRSSQSVKYTGKAVRVKTKK